MTFCKYYFFYIVVLLFSGTLKAQSGDTLSDLNPINFNDDFTAYNQRTAVYLAQLSELSYTSNWKDYNQFILRYLNTYPGSLVRSEFIVEKSKNTDTQILLWATPDFVVISFRGTEITKRNIITDLKYFSYEDKTPEIKNKYSNLSAGHGGFRTAIKKLIDNGDIFGRLRIFMIQAFPNKDIKKIPLYLTGHSLGGALASMFAEPLRFNDYTVKGLYLFAPALAVSCTERLQMEQNFGSFTYNIVNYKDYVPRAGLRGTLHHFGKFYRICSDSTLSKEPERYVKTTFFEKKRVLSYHKLANYIWMLNLPLNSDSQVSLRNSDCFATLKVIAPCSN